MLAEKITSRKSILDHAYRSGTTGIGNPKNSASGASPNTISDALNKSSLMNRLSRRISKIDVN